MNEGVRYKFDFGLSIEDLLGLAKLIDGFLLVKGRVIVFEKTREGEFLSLLGTLPAFKGRYEKLLPSITHKAYPKGFKEHVESLGHNFLELYG